MNFSRRDKSIVDFLFILALFGAFAITGLFVVLFGAKVYQTTVSKMEANYASRTALSYVTEKVRSHDYSENGKASGMEIREHDGEKVVVLKETINDRTFATYLYESEGKLMEFTADESYDFKYNAGTEILAVERFNVSQVNDALYSFDIVDEYGNNTRFFVTIYSGGRG